MDKWLQVARVFKTRSQAGRACGLGRVQVNGGPAKAHRIVAVGDRIETEKGRLPVVLVVRELRDRPVPKAEAKLLYEDHSPPPPPRDPMGRFLRRQPALREPGMGRPTKRERRRMDRLRGE